MFKRCIHHGRSVPLCIVNIADFVVDVLLVFSCAARNLPPTRARGLLSVYKQSHSHKQTEDTMTAQLDFAGHTIFAGMDVGKKSWKICILTEVLEHKTFTQPPSVSVLVNSLHRNFPGARYRAAYEAGYCGFWIHDELVQCGVDCIVVNPADCPQLTRKLLTRPTALMLGSLQEVSVIANSLPSMSHPVTHWKIATWCVSANEPLASSRGAKTKSKGFYNSMVSCYPLILQTATGPRSLSSGYIPVSCSAPAAIRPSNVCSMNSIIFVRVSPN